MAYYQVNEFQQGWEVLDLLLFLDNWHWFMWSYTNLIPIKNNTMVMEIL